MKGSMKCCYPNENRSYISSRDDGIGNEQRGEPSLLRGHEHDPPHHHEHRYRQGPQQGCSEPKRKHRGRGGRRPAGPEVSTSGTTTPFLGLAASPTYNSSNDTYVDVTDPLHSLPPPRRRRRRASSPEPSCRRERQQDTTREEKEEEEDRDQERGPNPRGGGPFYADSEQARLLRWNRGWTTLHEDMVRRWKGQVFVYMQLQYRSYIFFRNIYDLLTYPLLLLTIISAVIVNVSEDRGLRVAVAVLNGAATTLTAVLRQIGPAERSQSHRDVSAQFNVLMHTIESCMSVPFYMRPEAELFAEKVRSDLINLVMLQREPPGYVRDCYERRVGQIDGIIYGQDIIDITINNLVTKQMMKRLNEQTLLAHVKQRVQHNIFAAVDRMFEARWGDTRDRATT